MASLEEMEAYTKNKRLKELADAENDMFLLKCKLDKENIRGSMQTSEIEELRLKLAKVTSRVIILRERIAE